MVDVICYSIFMIAGIIWMFFLFMGGEEFYADVIRLVLGIVMLISGIVKLSCDIAMDNNFEATIWTIGISAIAIVIPLIDMREDY